MKATHPIQPLEQDASGVVRFKANAIVRYLLDAGPFDMNALAALDFSREDREQFAQLIGYSHSGFGELSYASDEVYEAAKAAYEHPETSAATREQVLRSKLDELRCALREPIARLYGRHPDDLMEAPE